MKIDRRWRRKWQVVKFFPNGALIVRCSHRWELTASLCSDWRDRVFAVRDRENGSWHDERLTPDMTDNGSSSSAAS